MMVITLSRMINKEVTSVNQNKLIYFLKDYYFCYIAVVFLWKI